ncbi:MAG TPA: hypothetical protein VMI74_18960, partial [Burkholderiales bacterium]|nr:hypothetical protein [Burkholderiales bacterium]
EPSQHAHQHEALAAKLESFEQTECNEFPPATPAACPLLGPVKTLTDIPTGVRVVVHRLRSQKGYEPPQHGFGHR